MSRELDVVTISGAEWDELQDVLADRNRLAAELGRVRSAAESTIGAFENGVIGPIASGCCLCGSEHQRNCEEHAFADAGIHYGMGSLERLRAALSTPTQSQGHET